ncbi:MAG: hypothetical protein COB51_07295 [Moraxellaceae bacterium]|nr:MAG: hypothetical protein COB51_07295 [Moraxellaceae bacterium]
MRRTCVNTAATNTNSTSTTSTNTTSTNTVATRTSLLKTASTKIVVLCGFALLTACAGSSAPSLGINEGLFLQCPPSPNCVNSQMKEDSHYIAPIDMSGSIEEKRDVLTKIIASLPRTKLIKSSENYLLVEFESKLMGYVDDVEFLIEADQIQVRSASRVGYSDLDANRKRIETIRRLTQF